MNIDDWSESVGSDRKRELQFLKLNKIKIKRWINNNNLKKTWSHWPVCSGCSSSSSPTEQSHRLSVGVCNEGGGSDPPGSVRWELRTGSSGSGNAGVAEFRLGPRRFPFLFVLSFINSFSAAAVCLNRGCARTLWSRCSLRARALPPTTTRPVHLSK